MNVLMVMIGGFFGAISRFLLSEWIHTGSGFSLATFLINLSGCFFLGWFLTFVGQRKKVRAEFTLLIGTGFTGAFTTFSAFSLETLELFEAGHLSMGIIYVLGSTVFGLTLTYAGYRLAKGEVK